GTVPLLSASLYNPADGFDDRGSGRDMYWCGLSHMGLAQDTAVWQAAEAYLEGSISYATDVLGAACPDGSLGTVAGLSMVNAPPSQPAGATMAGSPAETGCSSPSPTATSIDFVNDSASDALDVYWYDASCQEHLYATIPPQMQLLQTMTTGDVWHLRSHSTHSLIGTATGNGAAQTVIAT
ncbi:MAG: hypothetical protein ACRD1G_14485, partial [Acidimicrobiales bacterium]